jgi:hypothetical protein
MPSIPVRFQTGYRLVQGQDLNADFDALANAIGPATGVTYYVNSTRGTDANNGGMDPNYPLSTISAALALESAALTKLGLSSVGRNSIIAIWGTVRLSSTLTWSLPGTHLIGVGSPLRRGKRARISVTGSTAFSPMISVTAAGCYFGNFGTFYGFDSASNNAICWQDTGGRNTYDNIEFMGFGDNTASTGTANITGARAFKLNTSTGECSFYNCVFGVDTTDRDATNYTVELAGGAPRLYFESCDFECRLGSSGTAASHVLIGSAGIDRYVKFIGCRFSNFSTSAMAQALNVHASAGGTVILDQSTIAYNITAWQGTPAANVQMNMTPPDTGGGKAITNA